MTSIWAYGENLEAYALLWGLPWWFHVGLSVVYAIEWCFHGSALALMPVHGAFVHFHGASMILSWTFICTYGVPRYLHDFLNGVLFVGIRSASVVRSWTPMALL